MVCREGQTSGRGPRLSRWRRADDETRAQGGFSLIEICVTVAIMGIALALLVGSMATAESTSNLVTVRSQTESYGRRVAEVLRTNTDTDSAHADSLSLLCTNDLRATYQAHLITALAPTDYTITVGSVYYTNDWTLQTVSSWTHNSCVGSTPQREWVQFTVTSTESPAVSVTISVLQRNPSPL